MIRVLLASAAAFGFLVTGPAFAAHEMYTLKLYQSKKGDKAEREESKTDKTTVEINVDGEIKKEEITEGRREVFTEEILEKKLGNRHPSKLTRTYSVAETTSKGKTTKASYIGETVLVEKKNGKYEFSIKGKRLQEGDAPELFEEFSDRKDNDPSYEDLVPETPVKVGGTWTIPNEKVEQMSKMFGDKLKIDAKKSTIGGKLLKAYKKNNTQFAVMEFTFTLSMTEIDFGGLTKTKPGSKMVLKATIDACIDGTVQAQDIKLEMVMDIALNVPDVGAITIKGTTTATNKIRMSK